MLVKNLFLFRFWQLVIQNFLQKDGLDAVVVLAYTSLVGLVPLLAIIFSIFSFSDSFALVQDAMMKQLLPYLLPESAQQIEDYLLQFSLQAAQLPVVSIGVMLVTVLFLMSTVDEKINQMWHHKLRRIWWHSLLHYLGIALLGPVLLALSFILSSSLLALPLIEQVFQLSLLNQPLLSYLPVLFGVLGFAALYRWVPVKRVRWSAAFIGAVLVALAIYLLKLGFQYYMLWFPTYNLIYGAFAVVPIFLLWLYLIWFVIILGASVVRQLSLENPLQDKNAAASPV